MYINADVGLNYCFLTLLGCETHDTHFFPICFRLLCTKLIQWKTEKILMNGKKDFEDDETYIFVQCGNCDSMCSVDKFGIVMAVPGVPVFSTEMRNCSFCMDEKSLAYLTLK